MTFKTLQCPCGAMLKHADKFCWSCGAKAEKAKPEIIYDIFCLQCDKELSSGDKFCRMCGNDATLKKRRARPLHKKVVTYGNNI